MYRRKAYSHMTSRSRAEVDYIAARIGLKPHFWHKNHYDVPVEYFGKAVAAGALIVSTREIVRLVK